jgi:hypothetical protein
LNFEKAEANTKAGSIAILEKINIAKGDSISEVVVTFRVKTTVLIIHATKKVKRLPLPVSSEGVRSMILEIIILTNAGQKRPTSANIPKSCWSPVKRTGRINSQVNKYVKIKKVVS